MRSLLMLTFLLVFTLVSCGEDEGTDCGCDSEFVLRSFEEADSFIHYDNPGNKEGGGLLTLNVYVDEAQVQYVTYFICNIEDFDRETLANDGLRLVVSGEEKPVCTNGKYTGGAFKLESFELIDIDQ